MKTFFAIILTSLSVCAFAKDLFLVEITGGNVLLLGEKKEFTLAIYQKPDLKSQQLGVFSIKSGSRLPHADEFEITIGKEISRYGEAISSQFCGGQLFTFLLSRETSNGFYRISLDPFESQFGWVKGVGHYLIKDKDKLPLKLYSNEGYDITLENPNKTDDLKMTMGTESGETKTVVLPFYSDNFLSDLKSNIKLVCDLEIEKAIATKLLKPSKKEFFEPIVVNFLEDVKSLKTESQDSLPEFSIKASPKSNAETLGKFKVVKKNGFHGLFVSAKSQVTQAIDFNLFSNGSCRGEYPYMLLHAVKEREGKLVNLGKGPWGEQGWIEMKSYGLFTDAPYSFTWLSSRNWVKFRKEADGLWAIGSNVGARYNEPENFDIKFPVNFDELFDSDGKLDIDINCSYGC